MGSGDVAAFALHEDGAPGRRRLVAAGKGAFFPALTPNGSRLLVANALADSVSVLSVTRNGGLRPSQEAVPTTAPGPRGIAIAPDGRHAWVAHYNDGTGSGSVVTLRLGGDGPVHRQGRPVPTGGNGAEAMAVDPGAKRLYVANFNTGLPGTISTFAIGSGGDPALVGPPVPTGGREPDFGGLVIGFPHGGGR